MKVTKTTVLIVGGGTAGLSAHAECRRAGVDALLVNAGPWGTTCARVGCMPSKLLLAAAHAAHHAESMDELGVRASGVAVDGEAVMQRVQRERDRFVSGVVSGMDRIPLEQRRDGRVQFLDKGRARIDDTEEVHFERVVIATGSSPFVPKALAPAEDRLLTSDDLFDLPTLPASIAVIGSGVIGMELGQALSRLGVRTTILDLKPTLGWTTDRALDASMLAHFNETLDLRLGALNLAAERTDSGVRLTWDTEEQSGHSLEASMLLVATGRTPNLDGLAVDKLGVYLPTRGPLPVDPETLQWGELPLFFAGDVNGTRPLLHEASDEGHIAGHNAAIWPKVRRAPRRTPLLIVFTDPQFARAGAAICDLIPEETVLGTVDFGRQGRARVMNRAVGRAHLYADVRTRKLVAAQIFGPEAEHLGHLMAWAIDAGDTVDTLLTRPFYHPVLEEGLRTALRDLLQGLSAQRTLRVEDFSCPRAGD